MFYTFYFIVKYIVIKCNNDKLNINQEQIVVNQKYLI